MLRQQRNLSRDLQTVVSVSQHALTCWLRVLNRANLEKLVVNGRKMKWGTEARSWDCSPPFCVLVGRQPTSSHVLFRWENSPHTTTHAALLAEQSHDARIFQNSLDEWHTHAQTRARTHANSQRRVSVLLSTRYWCYRRDEILREFLFFGLDLTWVCPPVEWVPDSVKGWGR